jgi:hypothetical protein
MKTHTIMLRFGFESRACSERRSRHSILKLRVQHLALFGAVVRGLFGTLIGTCSTLCPALVCKSRRTSRKRRGPVKSRTSRPSKPRARSPSKTRHQQIFPQMSHGPIRNRPSLGQSEVVSHSGETETWSTLEVFV